MPPDSAPVKGGAAFGPKLIPGIKPLPSLPAEGGDRKAPDRPKLGLGDLKSTGPMIGKDAPKKNILSTRDERVKAAAEKRKTELQNLKKTDPEAYRAKVEKGKKIWASLNQKKAAQKATPVGNIRTADMQDRNLDGTDDRDQQERPAVAVRKPFKSFRPSQKGPGRNVNTRAGLRGAKPAPKPAAKPMRGKPATRYMEEKIDLEKAEMGEVIRDFQKSDAPQFKGKSKAKRRMMAIAAKLQAERG